MAAKKAKHPGGRPTELTAKVHEEARRYLREFSSEEFGNQAIPTLEGLAFHLGVSRKTLYNWEADAEFLHTLDKLRSAQAMLVLNGGIRGTYNATIAKLILSTNHGYAEKSEGTVDVTSKGEKMPGAVDGAEIAKGFAVYLSEQTKQGLSE